MAIVQPNAASDDGDRRASGNQKNVAPSTSGGRWSRSLSGATTPTDEAPQRSIWSGRISLRYEAGPPFSDWTMCNIFTTGAPATVHRQSG